MKTLPPIRESDSSRARTISGAAKKDIDHLHALIDTFRIRGKELPDTVTVAAERYEGLARVAHLSEHLEIRLGCLFFGHVRLMPVLIFNDLEQDK